VIDFFLCCFLSSHHIVTTSCIKQLTSNKTAVDMYYFMHWLWLLNNQTIDGETEKTGDERILFIRCIVSCFNPALFYLNYYFLIMIFLQCVRVKWELSARHVAFCCNTYCLTCKHKALVKLWQQLEQCCLQSNCFFQYVLFAVLKKCFSGLISYLLLLL